MNNKYFIALILMAFASCTFNIFSYDYRISNRTRGKLAVKLNMIAAKDENIEIDPETHYDVSLGGVRAGACIRSLEIQGMSQPVSNLSTTYKVKGNQCQGNAFWIAHHNAAYINPTGIEIGGSSDGSDKPRLGIMPNSGVLTVEQE